MLVKRAAKRTTHTAVIRSWRSTDGRWSVEEITSLFGLPRYYIVTGSDPGGLLGILSRHRKRQAAVRAYERYASR